jgi:hypothetical protein
VVWSLWLSIWHFLIVGYLLNYPLTPHLVHTPQASFASLGCGDVVAIRTSGQVFLSRHMDGDLVYALIVTTRYWSTFYCWLCASLGSGWMCISRLCYLYLKSLPL